MRILEIKKPIASLLVGIMLLGQAVFVTQYLFIPKPAKAFGPSFTVGDIPRIIEHILEAAAVRIAQSYAEKYLSRFAEKLIDKFKIRNFLYYDQYLSDYYLSNLILNNIDDPDLREAADIMYRISVSGQMGGYSNGGFCQGATLPREKECIEAGGKWVGTIDPRKALIPQLKQAIANLYINQGGIDPNKVYYPAAGVSDREYFATAQAYFANPPSFTEQNIRGQFGAFQSTATTAAQLEILTGNSLKAGRIIGGTCGANANTPAPIDVTAAKDPRACAAIGGTWQASALDRARDLINNPTGKINTYIQGALESLFQTTFDASNPWTRIGGALGSYIFTQLEIDKDTGVFNEYGESYKIDTGELPKYNELDLDGDGIPDGQDVDGDGKLINVLDTCYHGGVANQVPGCTPSGQVGTSPYFTPLCSSIDKTITALTDYSGFISRNKGQIEDQDNFVNAADVRHWTDKTQAVKIGFDGILEAIISYRSNTWEEMQIRINRMAALMDAVWLSLQEDQDLELDDQFGSVDGVDNLERFTNDYLNYLTQIKAQIGKCDNPNIAAIAAIPPPDLVTAPPGGGGGRGGGFIPCANPPSTISPDPMGVMLQVRSEFPGLDLTDETAGGGRDQFTAIVAWRLAQGDGNWGRKRSGPAAPISTDTLGYLRPDIGPGRFEAVDMVVGGSGALQRGCYGVVGAGQVWEPAQPA